MSQSAHAHGRRRRRRQGQRPGLCDHQVHRQVVAQPDEVCCQRQALPDGAADRAQGRRQARSSTSRSSSTDVIVSSVATGGSGGEDRLTENVTLNFAKFEVIVHAAEGATAIGDATSRTSARLNIAGNIVGSVNASAGAPAIRAAAGAGILRPPVEERHSTMHAAEELVQAGRLAEALADLQGEVRKDPANRATARSSCSSCCAVMGQWDRALTQLKVAGELDADARCRWCRPTATRCSAKRCARDVRRQARARWCSASRAEWLALLLEALQLDAQGKHDAGRARCARRPSSRARHAPGKIDGKPFDWIADADRASARCWRRSSTAATTGCRSSACARSRFEKPTDLRDLVWTPAQLTLANGGETVALIPTRYPGSEKRAADAGIAWRADRMGGAGARHVRRPRPAHARHRRGRLPAAGRRARSSSKAIRGDAGHRAAGSGSMAELTHRRSACSRRCSTG